MMKGKVVLVPFPFDDLSANKVRPAVCLTNPVGGGISNYGNQRYYPRYRRQTTKHTSRNAISIATWGRV